MYLLTGKPNTGKSTVMKHLINILGRRRCGGFYTNEILDENRNRIGFMTHTLSGDRFLLAHVDIDSEYQIEEFKVNLKDVDEIAVNEILDNDREYLFIDEIGMMQLYSEKFKDAVRSVSSNRKTIATISLIDNEFTSMLKYDPHNTLYTLAFENRNEMPFVMAKEIMKDDEIFLSKIQLSEEYHNHISRFTYEEDRVILESTHDTRIITRDDKGYHCTCDYYNETGTCSHIMAVVRNNILRIEEFRF